MRTLLFLIAFLYTGLSFADSPAPLVNATLKQCYELALKRSETIAIQQQVIKEAEGRFYQSMGTFLPHVSFVDSEERRENTHGSIPAYAPERAFTFTQSLFSGFKEFAGIAASKAEKQQRRFELVRAKQLLFTDVTDAFYLFKSYQERLNALSDNERALTEYRDELKRRQSLGRSRASEVANAESRLYQNEATISSVTSQMEVTRQLLEFLVGLPVRSVANEDVMLDTVRTQEEYVGRAGTRPDVQAADQAALVARRKVTIARAGYFPNVTLSGNRYLKRAGSDSGIDWDITLNISVPIFNGTITYGEVRTAAALAEEAKLAYARTKRQAVLDIQNAYTRVVEGQKQVLAYRKAAEAAAKNYDLQKEDFKNSLVNALDVLDVVQELYTVRQDYIAVKSDAQRAYWALKVAAGDISDDSL